MEKHVVVIYPHPDDESFGAAGTMTKYRKEGVPVTYLCGTLGEMGRNMGSPTFANRETLPEIRKEELIQACNILDVDLQLLGYRDKTIEYEDRGEVAAHLKGILEEIKPSLVITHYPEHAVHPDHNALGAAAIEAVRLMDAEDRPVVWAQAITNNYHEILGEPDVTNDISEYFETKMEAIMSHASQASGILGQFKKDDDDINELAKKRFTTEQFYIWQFND
ncbi:bacillithiol biosynthesis deacetylase BshB2 [Virgibacillus profundi]|uniref:Bacillithiol biosynthesis deacetylase BshB2 n=1 Tax=Virgibacillus profundi TaxID=2024555 RepID=A0A2A2I6Y7_9BACI|nr:bacillithiol biosynthesis deacetylase BshB2 [Virgibacillus profundi]PAV27771.1 bacillithiol biosynthesis deacetylase BshB2 [Virgibacillus profundi]PXY51926.1 bacillithiol biosynthesis deacetylase BshB2 [Virgibacillus profundi]